MKQKSTREKKMIAYGKVEGKKIKLLRNTLFPNFSLLYLRKIGGNLLTFFFIFLYSIQT